MYFRDGKRIIPDWRTSEESFRDGSSGLTGGKLDEAIEMDTMSVEREIFIILNVLLLVSSSVKVLNILQMFESIGS